MGSPLRLTISPGPGVDVEMIERAWAQVVGEFEAAEGAMSRFRESSDLTLLNRVAGLGVGIPVDRRLERAMAVADRARRLTGGRFDPRVLADLERLGYRGATLPSLDATGRTLRPVAGERVAVRVGAGRLAVDRPVDLGGIGKGLALRWAATRIDRLGVGDFLLEAGGDLVARGAAPQGGPWLVGVEDPAGGGEPRAVIAAQDVAVATSSVRVHAWVVEGRPVHHLLDPSTGEPGGGGLASVTVAGADPAWSEVWSKALFVTGRDGIAAEARARGLAAWWISFDGTLEMTPAARARTAWVAGEH